MTSKKQRQLILCPNCGAAAMEFKGKQLPFCQVCRYSFSDHFDSYEELPWDIPGICQDEFTLPTQTRITLKYFRERFPNEIIVAEYWPVISERERIDFAFPVVKLAIEIEGGVWTGGRHTRGAGFVNDCNKYNRLESDLWHVLRYQPEKIDWDQIKKTLNNLGR